jgi:Flp pilus assembly protein TadG
MIRRAVRRGGEEGTAAVEMAAALSALMFLILGAFWAGLLFWNWNTMLLAVEEAGRYAMLYNPTTLTNSKITLASVCPSGVTTVNLANCAIAWGKENGGSSYEWSCTDVSTGSACSGSTTQMLFKTTYTFPFIISISLSRGIQVLTI